MINHNLITITELVRKIAARFFFPKSWNPRIYFLGWISFLRKQSPFLYTSFRVFFFTPVPLFPLNRLSNDWTPADFADKAAIKQEGFICNNKVLSSCT